MRIGIDARLLTYRRGMGNFVYNLLTELVKLPGDEQYILYVDDMRAAQCAPQGPRFVVKRLWSKIYPVWEQVSLPLAITRDRLDVLHCPANTAPLFLPKHIKLALTIHDVMYALPKSVLPHSPCVYQRVGRMYYYLFARLAVKRAACVMTVSEHSRNDLSRVFHLSTKHIRVVYEAGNPICHQFEGMSLVDEVKERKSITGRYIFALGALDPRKNTLGVLQSLVRFRAFSALPIQLVIAGLAGDAKSQFAALAGDMGLRKQVVLLEFISEQELAALYNGADVFVYPSLYEGFGMPVLEAMACGTPVITSSAGSIPEVAGNAALFIDPYDPSAIAEAILRVINDVGLREQMIGLGLEQARKFSWNRTAQQVLKVYRECLVP
jgi:glycosyltransferase involved in cell wall biosynthesis